MWAAIRAMFRMLSSEGLFNYHELLLVKNQEGGVEVTDLYVFASGETMSQTLRRGALAVIAAKNSSAVTRLLKGEQDFLQHFETINAMNQANREGKFQQALDLYAKLPAKLQDEKSTLLIRVNAARQVDDKLYRAALDDFAKAFPRDPACDLMLIDAYAMREEFDKCLATIDRLDKRVGGDPYLDSIRGNMALSQGKTEEAKPLFKAAIAGAPMLPQPYFELASISLDEKDFAETARLMTILEKELDIQFPDDLSQIELFQTFSQSPEYAAWQAQRKKPAGEAAPADAGNGAGESPRERFD